MLTELYVEHFVLIHALRIHFHRGLHVFTGETGAGKSILFDAVRMVMGERASTANIQHGFDHAVVEAVFDDVNQRALDLLTEWGIDATDHTVIVSRTVFQNGRSVCRINGRTVTVHMLKSIGAVLVEMQDQHESHNMLTSTYQRELLDSYGQYHELQKQTQESHVNWQKNTERLKSARVSEQQRAQQIDMLERQIEELEQAHLDPLEEPTLRKERTQLVHYGKLQSHIERLLQALEDPRRGALTMLVNGMMEADWLVEQDEQFQNIRDMLYEAQVHVEEVSFSLNKLTDKIDANPGRLEEIDSRLADLRSLLRKYGPDVADALQHLDNCREKLVAWQRYDDMILEMTKSVREAKSVYMERAQALHNARTKAARKFADEVQARLHELNMLDARFDVQVTADSSEEACFEHGYDRVEYIFSANRGQPLLPLQKVASGGELSRTLLALKVVVAGIEQIETLFFDEIDAGVSGDAAERVAKMLRTLGNQGQVLCVTHSAQVAAAGHEHFEIAKEAFGDQTQTCIRPLNDSERKYEVGRLLGAGVSDETALRHADALLASFRNSTISTS